MVIGWPRRIWWCLQGETARRPQITASKMPIFWNQHIKAVPKKSMMGIPTAMVTRQYRSHWDALSFDCANNRGGYQKSNDEAHLSAQWSCQYRMLRLQKPGDQKCQAEYIAQLRRRIEPVSKISATTFTTKVCAVNTTDVNGKGMAM